jgi:hypothetical protein
MDILDIADRYSVTLTRGIRVHALFGITFLVQMLNTALRHGHQAGYWAYIVLLEGPAMLLNLVFIYKCQQWWAKRKQIPHPGSILWSFGR